MKPEMVIVSVVGSWVTSALHCMAFGLGREKTP